MNKQFSPCIGVCKLEIIGVQKLCSGCYRTIEEISVWSNLDGTEKEKVISLTKLRKYQHLLDLE